MTLDRRITGDDWRRNWLDPYKEHRLADLTGQTLRILGCAVHVDWVWGENYGGRVIPAELAEKLEEGAKDAVGRRITDESLRAWGASLSGRYPAWTAGTDGESAGQGGREWFDSILAPDDIERVMAGESSHMTNIINGESVEIPFDQRLANVLLGVIESKLRRRR